MTAQPRSRGGQRRVTDLQAGSVDTRHGLVPHDTRLTCCPCQVGLGDVPLLDDRGHRWT